MEVVARAGQVVVAAPEPQGELRHADIELIDELRADPAEATLARALPQPTALEERDVRLAALGEEVRHRGADNATADDDGGQGSSTNEYLPSCCSILPKRGTSCVNATIQRSAIARGRITFFAASVSSG